MGSLLTAHLANGWPAAFSMPEGLHPFRWRSPLLRAPTSASHPDFPLQLHRPLMVTPQVVSSIPNFPHSSPLTWLVFRPKLGSGFSLKPSGVEVGSFPLCLQHSQLRVHSSIYYLPWQLLAFSHLQTSSPRAGLLHHHKSHCDGKILSKKMYEGKDNQDSEPNCVAVLSYIFLLCLPHDRPTNWRWGVEARNIDFIWKAGRLRRWQTSVSE